MKHRDRIVGSVAGGLAATLVHAAARAAEPAIDLAIPEQPREEALIAFGARAGLSLGFSPGVRCGGRAGVRGRLTASQALQRLLDGSGCVAVRLDERTILIARGKRPSPRLVAAAAARPAGQTAASVLPDVIVTAPKRPMLLAKAPYAISVLDGAHLMAQGASDPTDLPALAPGVIVTNLGAGRDKILLRGLADGPLTGYAQSTVGLYFDDLRVAYNAPDPDLRWTDVRRVEVLRGSQGSLYGAGSIGGVIQVVANAPDPAARLAEITVSGAASAGADPSGDVEAVVNQPFAGDRAALRLVGWSERNGGFIDNVATGRRRENDTLRTGARASVLWQAGSDLTLQLFAIEQTIAARDTQYSEPALGPYLRSTPNLEPHDNDFAAAGLNLRWRGSGAELVLDAAYIDHHVTSRYDATTAPITLAAAGRTPEVLDDDNYMRGVVGEARASSLGAGRTQWLLGAFVSHTRQRLYGQITDDAGGAGYAENRRDEILEAAVFGELAYDLAPRLTLTLGGRLFATRLRVSSAASLAGPLRTFEGRAADGGFAPKAVLAFRPAAPLTLYVQAAEGYRTSGFNTAGPPGQTFGLVPGAAQPLQRYAGDELWSFEAGVHWSAPDGSAQVRAAAFDALWRGVQADVLLPSGLPFTANLGDGRVLGVELEAARRFGPLTLALNGLVDDPELVRIDPGLAPGAVTGLAGAPRVSFTLLAAYERPLPRGWDLALSSRYAYVGRSRLAFPAAVAPEMGDHGNLRASVALRRRGFRVELFGENLAGGVGDTFAYGNPFLLWKTRLANPQRPRTIGVTLSRAL